VRRGILALAAVAGAAALPAPALAAEGDRLLAGAAAADITPPIGTPMFAYTARSRVASPDTLPEAAQQLIADPDHNHYAKTFAPSKGIHTRVKARAVVLQRGDRKLALVQADLGGLPYAMLQEVVRRAAGTGITADNILLSATHTHSSTGPIWPADNMGYAVLGGDLFDPRIFELTAQGIAESIIAADARLGPARLGVGSATLRDASRNRAFEPFRRNADVPKDEAGARDASIDPELHVVRVDSDRGRPLAVWSNFAIHPTSFGDDNLLFSGDNAGYAERIAEGEIARAAGGAAPINVWTNSNEGDISPNGSPDQLAGEELQRVPNAFASAHMAGLRVGRGTVEAWRAAGKGMSRTPELGVARTMVDFDGTEADGEPVGPLGVLGFGGVVGPEGTCAPADGTSGPGQGLKFPLFGGPASPAGPGIVPRVASVSVARVGSLGIAAFPSEVTKQMGGRIRNAALGEAKGSVDRMALAGLTNGYLSYTATPEEYDACHYEGSFTLFGRRQGPRYQGVARSLSAALFGAGPMPAGADEPVPLGFSSQELGARETPSAGEVASQPPATVKRLGRAVFTWRGGDPALEAPRGRSFVTLERREGSSWRAFGTDDGFFDTTERGPGDVYTETWQFTECDPAGEYRFRVRGRADRGSGPEDYEVTSRPFRVEPASLSVGQPAVSGGFARVRGVYPDPGTAALLALPRFARSGFARLEVDGRRVRANPDPNGVDFVAKVRDGASVRAIDVRDGCGNAGTP
jgi:neutral ceramidase